MLVPTKGLVLSNLKYRESSLICRVFTEQLGLQSYVVNGVRTAKARLAPSLFEPLTLLDLVVYHTPRAELHRIKEVRCHLPYMQMPLEPSKTAIRFFLAEVLSQVLFHETHEGLLDQAEGPHTTAQLYQFLEQALQVLDLLPTGLAGYPIQFLMKLSQVQGFAPANASELLDHLAQPAPLIDHLGHMLSPQEQARLLLAAMQQPLGQASEIGQLPGPVRSQLLAVVLDFWRFQLQQALEIRSLPILHQLLT